MKAEQFFGGRWRGDGEVASLFGRVLRRFDVSFDGTWSEEHRAFHVDESVHYEDGRAMERRWVIHTDGEGMLVGFDAMQASRMRVRPRGDGFRIVFDRPVVLVRSAAPRAAVLDIRISSPGRLRGEGWSGRFGVPLARTRLELVDVSPPA